MCYKSVEEAWHVLAVKVRKNEANGLAKVDMCRKGHFSIKKPTRNLYKRQWTFKKKTLYILFTIRKLKRTNSI